MSKKEAPAGGLSSQSSEVVVEEKRIKFYGRFSLRVELQYWKLPSWVN